MSWKDWFKFTKTPVKTSLIRRIVGIVLIIIGFISLITPFTPGSWLIFVGFGVLGINLVAWDKIKERFKK